jgi:hypothetical protein
VDEAAKRSWDVWLGILAPLLTVAGILIGVWQFNVGESRKAEYEHASKLWLQRVDTYTSVAKLAGRIASAPDDTSFKQAVNDFMSAYWGDMILVEDTAVEQAMIDFRIEVQDYLQQRSSADRLKIRADALMNSFRKSISEQAPHP